MTVYLRDGPENTIVGAAIPREKLQIKVATSPIHSILTPGPPLLALTLQRQAPSMVNTTVSINRLVGLVVKASASRTEDPGFESRLRRVIPVT